MNKSKFIILILILFFSENLFSKGLDLGLSPYLFSPSSISVTSTITFNTNIGVANGILFTNYIKAKLSKIIVPEIKIAFFSDERIISTPNSKIKLYIVPTNEEVMIARDTVRVAKIN